MPGDATVLEPVEESDVLPTKDCAGVPIGSWCVFDQRSVPFDAAVCYRDLVLSSAEVTHSLSSTDAHLKRCMQAFLRNRRVWKLPVRLNLNDWPSPMPYVKNMSDGKCYPSVDSAALTHKRCAIEQICLIELGGALVWMDQFFHPLSSWTKYVQALSARNRFLERSQTRPRWTSAYRRAVAQIRACADAARSNDPATFCANMGVFCERVFAKEPSSSDLTLVNGLSYTFAEMLHARVLLDLRLSHGKDDEGVDREVGQATLQQHVDLLIPWFYIINELSYKADAVAVLVVDALCNSIARSACADVADLVFEMAGNLGSRKLENIAFTDTTAPMFCGEYWSRKPTRVDVRLEAVSRFMNYATPRARFPDTPYAKSLVHTVNMFTIFLKLYNIDTLNSLGFDICQSWIDDKSECFQNGHWNLNHPRKLLKSSIDASHFFDWNAQTLVFAACAMLKYARSRRAVVYAIREEATEDLSKCGSARLHSAEIYANLDQAELMLEFLLSLPDVLFFREWGPGYEEMRGEVSVYLREIKNVREHWHTEDSKYSKAFATKKREQRKAIATLVHNCAKRACNNVLLRAQISDAQEKLSEMLEENARTVAAMEASSGRLKAAACIAQILSRAPRFAKRRADAVARAECDRARTAKEAEESRKRHEARARSLAIAIAYNRAAVKRREEALAKRAKVEQRALLQERREASKARSQAYKAEVAQRNARIREEAEAAERARLEREAKAKATRAVEEARAAEEQRRRDADAKLAAEVQEREKAAVLAAEADRARQKEKAAAEAARAASTAVEAEKEDADVRHSRSRRCRLLRKAANFLRAKAIKLWRARVEATKKVEARRVTQEHCNAIFMGRKNYKKMNPQRRLAYRLRAERGELLHDEDHCSPSWTSSPVPDEGVPPLASPTASNKTLSPLPLPSPPQPEAPDSPPPPAAPPPPPAAPPPPPPPPPPLPPASAPASAPAPAPTPAPAHRTITAEDVEAASAPLRYHPVRQWQDDYNKAHAHARAWSQQQWDTKTGWATGRDEWYVVGGYPYVAQMTQARQEQDVQYARFQANFKHMQRLQQKQHEGQVKHLARTWQIQQDRYEEKLAELDFEQKRVEELEAEIAEIEKQREDRRTRYAVLREYLDGLEAATEQERRELSAKRCEQIRNRTGTYDVSLGVNECVFCFEKLCDHIATPCNHVIGCEACTIKHRNAKGSLCPICCTPATFEKMHLP